MPETIHSPLLIRFLRDVAGMTAIPSEIQALDISRESAAFAFARVECALPIGAAALEAMVDGVGDRGGVLSAGFVRARPRSASSDCYAVVADADETLMLCFESAVQHVALVGVRIYTRRTRALFDLHERALDHLRRIRQVADHAAQAVKAIEAAVAAPIHAIP